MDFKFVIIAFVIYMAISSSASVISNIYSIKNHHNNFSVFQQQKCSNGSCTVTKCSTDDPCKTSKLNSNNSSSSLLPFSNENFNPAALPSFLP